MKKLLTIILSLILIFSLTACKDKDKQETSSTDDNSAIEIISEVSDKEYTHFYTQSEKNTSTTISEGDKICDHDYEKATCEKPSTCKKCGATKGKALGHVFSDSKNKKCARCGYVLSDEHTHYFDGATCTQPKTCVICKATEGKALGHNYTTATCTEASTCKRCFTEKEKALGHNIVNGTCGRCGVVAADLKKALYLGDSICFGDKDDVRGTAWSGRIEENLNIKGTNAGVCGWYLSNKGAQIVTEFGRVTKDNYGYIIIQGGVNDIWSGKGVLGSVSPEGTTKFDTSTVAGALEDLFQTAKNEYPHAKIGFVINFRCSLVNQSAWDSFTNVAIEACEKWDIPYLHLDANQDFSSEFNVNVHLADGIHPNAAGYDILAKHIGNWMQTL